MTQLLLVELETVRNASDMPPAVVDKDAVLITLILGMSRDFQELSDRVVEIGAQTEIFDVESFTDRLLLKAWPVDTGQSFKVFHDPLRQFGAATEVDSSYYYLDAENGKVELFQKYAIGRKTLKVMYTGGMAVLDSPQAGQEFWNLYPDVAEAIIFEVIEKFKKIPNLGSTVVRIGQDWSQMTELKNRSPYFKRIAMQYKRMNI